MFYYFIFAIKIVPIQLSYGKQQLNTWIQHESNELKRMSLKRSLDLFTYKEDLACIGIIDKSNRIKSLSLLQKDEFSELHLKCVQTEDNSSGSLLVKAMANIAPEMNLSIELDDRWKIAFLYYLSQRT